MCVGAVLAGPTLAAIAARSRYPASRRGWRCPPRPRSLHAVRGPQEARRRRRHASCLGRSRRCARCVVGSAIAPARDRAFAALSPRATVIPPRCDAGTVRCLLADSRHTLRQHLRSPRQTPRPAERRAWQGAALGRAACASPRWVGAPLPPPAGPPSAGVRAERAGRSAAVCRWSPTPFAPNALPPPLSRCPRRHTLCRTLLLSLIILTPSAFRSPPLAGRFFAAFRRPPMLRIRFRARAVSYLARKTSCSS